MSYKLYNYKNTGYTFTHAPYSTHLIVQSPQEDPTKIYYVSADNQKELWIYTIATHSDAQLDVDPANASGDGKSRLQKVQSLFYDRTQGYIWGVDCDNDNVSKTFYVWYIDISNDAVTELGSKTFANKCHALDIVEIEANTHYVFEQDHDGIASYTLRAYNVDAHPFTDSGNTPRTGVLIPAKRAYAYTTATKAYLGCTESYALFYIYDATTNTWTIDDAGAVDTEFSSNSNQWALTYNDGVLQYILYDTGDSKYYLHSYTIATSAHLDLGLEYNIALMSDRNSLTTNPIGFNMEKGFDVSLDANNCAKVYQISKGRSNLLAIAQLQLGAGDSIVAVTDSYLVVNDSGTIKLYQYVDFMSYIGPRSVIKARQRNHWSAELYIYKTGDLGDLLIFDGMWVSIIGPLTSAGSTENNAIVFEGYLKFSKLLNPRKCTVDSPALFNLRTKLTADTYSGRTDEIIVDIIAVDAPNIVANDMDAGAAMGDYVVKGSKSLLTQLNTFAQQDAFTWVFYPDQGQLLLNYNDGTVDSGIDIDENDDISEVDGTKQRDIINQVTVKGTINPATGEPYTGTYNDTASQKIYSIQPIYRHFAGLASDALCLAQATSICTIQQQVPFRYTFRKEIGAEGLVLPGETITFAYALGEDPVASGQRIVDSLQFFFRAGVCYWTVEDALSFTSELELLYQEVEENSDLIEQLSVNVPTILAAPAISSGAGAPGSTPSKIGDIYVDTTNLNIYVAGGTGGSYSWGLCGKAQSSAFVAGTVAGLQVWLDAELGITKDGADLVSQWNDQSGNGNKCTQGVAANKPLWVDNQINGLATVRFDGTTDYISSAAIVLSQPLTIFIVLKVISSSAIDNDWISGLSIDTNLREKAATNPNQIDLYAGTHLLGAAFIDGTFYLWRGLLNGAASATERNNDGAVAGNAGAGNMAGYRIGANNSAAAFSNIEVAEVLIYNSSLSAANIIIVETYLNNKYAIY